jgi:hypothetical protein
MIRWVFVAAILLSLFAGSRRALADGWTMPRWMPFAKRDAQKQKSPTIKKRAHSAEKGSGKGLALKKPQMVTDLQNNTKKLIGNGKNMLTLKKTGRSSRPATIKKDKSVPKSTGEWMALPQVKP